MPFKSPKAIVETVCSAGCAKSELPSSKQLVLGILAGAYVGFGGLLGVVVSKGSPTLTQANPGLSKFLFGAVFPVGIIMIIIAGAELFTGNVGLITPACLTGAAKWKNLLRNWGVVYVGNFIGSLIFAYLIAYQSGLVQGNDLGTAVAAMAEAKVKLTWGQALLRGIGCNWLVCLGIYMTVAADDIASKILAVWFPIMAFVTLGMEHSIANMFFIPLGMLNGANVTLGQFLWNNLLPVTLGNIIGGAVLVGGVYWWIYGREGPAK